ncbi:MAG: phosphate acetyltransferase, partial [Solirubrobacterales bacterium]|nr:phosphate acetyltransferase [Solirubrobacterales bacterium]
APTVEALADACQARVLGGDPLQWQREALGFVVAAMTLPNLLDRLVEGAVAVTPGDRADVLLGVLSAQASGSFPPVSGLFRTGGLELPPSISRLLDGLDSRLPIALARTDTFETVTRLAAVRGRLDPKSERKVETALALFEEHVDGPALLERTAVRRSSVVTPLMFEYDLLDRARSDRRHVVLPEGDDERVLRAADTLLRRGVAELTLLGEEPQVRAKAARLGVEVDGAQVLDPHDPALRERAALEYARMRAHKSVTPEMARDVVLDVSYFGTMLMVLGLADGMVSGAAHTTADKVRMATALVRERRPDLSVEGPIQYDAAVDASVARSKLPASDVAGRATVFIFPDLNTGNTTYKAVQRSAGALAVGPVLQGLRRPVNDLSRGATVRDIVNTVAITAIQAQA